MNKNDKTQKKIGKIVVDRDLCIGAAPCEVIAPNTFELDDEGKAVVKSIKVDSYQDIIDAAMSCPVSAIKVYDQNGNLIYPK